MATSNIPLCVDLDGTLIQSDLLMESALKLLYKNPLNVFRFVAWIAWGNAHVKRQIAKRIHIDATCLPYNIEFLDWMRKASKGRGLVLCTASDQLLADAVATHVGGFQLILGSDGIHNLSGINKGLALRERFGERGFDSTGNGRKDMAVRKHARRAVIVKSACRLADTAGRVCEVEQILAKTHSQ